MTKKEKLKHTLAMIVDTFEENEKMFHQIFEIAPEGITIVDPLTMRFVKCNTNALTLLKYSAEEISNIGPLNISPEFQLDGRRSEEKAQEYIRRALNGEKMVFEWLVVNGEGNAFIAEVRIVAMMNEGDSHLYASFTDITERKRTEEKIESQNKRLYEIAFLQSHQVRAPVANILGLISLFNFKDLNDPLNAELLLKVETATKDFDKLIKEIAIKASQVKEE